ncbi:MAG: mannose-1-phosphate guanylyltransferase [Myxococcota bacterium]
MSRRRCAPLASTTSASDALEVTRRSPPIHAVILAGGAGERFWPASRQAFPKPFLRVVGGKTLLDATAARGRRAAVRDGLWVVCGEEHARPIRRALPGMGRGRVLVEPMRRNTAAAVCLAALRIAAEDPEAVMLVLPADHHIPDARAFVADIRKAARAAAEEDVLVTLGVEPTRPETGYGYIQRSTAVGSAHPGMFRVRRFVEKPDAKTARRYLRQGGYSWNAGIFVWKAQTILEELERYMPELLRVLAPVASRRRAPGKDALARAYERAPSAPIDTAVLERSQRVWTLPVSWAWSDVGTWESLAQELGVGPGESRVVEGELRFDEPGGNLVWGPAGKPVTLLGVEGLAVIDAGDALLVTRLDRSNDVRGIVKALKAQGRGDVT